MPSTRSTTELRAEACKHIMRLAGIESDSELVTILEKNGVLKAGLVFLVRADKPTLAKMTLLLPGVTRRPRYLPPRPANEAKRE